MTSEEVEIIRCALIQLYERHKNDVEIIAEIINKLDKFEKEKDIEII